MFGNVLGTLTTLLPKNFIFGSWVPVLIFGFINGVLLYTHFAAFRAFAAGELAKPIILVGTVIFVASVVFAYVLSSLSGVLREILEGRYLPGVIANALRAHQQAKVDGLDELYETAQSEAHRLVAHRRLWTDALSAAMRDSAGDAARANPGSVSDVLEPVIAGLREVRAQTSLISYATLDRAVNQTLAALKTYRYADDTWLQREYDALLILITYAANAAQANEVRLFSDRHTRFGGFLAAPTQMGNIAQSLEAYAATRYGFDLDTFWSRLQPVLEKSDPTTYAVLVAAKTQLDFIVACHWLATATTLVWFVAFAVAGASLWSFLGIAILGPLVAYGIYLLAVPAYVAYGQLVRAAIDLNRFILIQRLHLPLPNSLREERALWRGLRTVSSFGRETTELSYEHPPQ